jgi:hypothetical protein
MNVISRTTVSGIASAAMLATSLLVATPAAEAQPRYYNSGPAMMHSPNDDWVWRRHHRPNYGYNNGYRYNNGYGYGFNGYGYGFGYDNGGALVAAGILGLMAGALVANPIRNTYPGGSYCQQRFRSYNPATGTYTGYDGFQHPCP